MLYDGDGHPTAEYGLLKGCFFHGLDLYEQLVHSISTREIIMCSSRGLSEPGTLFKNLMAILRDIVQQNRNTKRWMIQISWLRVLRVKIE